ncbi:MAG: HypC/HybG/HupF family hydrogenase formation chaperone [Candidatus Zipacnadales bacterium]
MCVAVPGLVERIEGLCAIVDVGGAMVQARLDLLPEAREGDWVLIHAGFALEKVDEQYARETLELLAEIDTLKAESPVEGLQ